MHRFFASVIQPALEKIRPSSIVEIGAGAGENTRFLMQLCEAYNCTLHSIDPNPSFDPEEWQNLYGDRFVFYKRNSLDALPDIESYDAILIDGDHNWYTVYHELIEIQKYAQKSGEFPLVFIHDVGWPYGRRDMYHDPDSIPEHYRHPHAQKGIIPSEPGLVEVGGIETGAWNAEREGTIQNGVKTAVEDFLRSTQIPLSYFEVNGMFGLGIIASNTLLEQNRELLTFLQTIHTPEILKPLMKEIEEDRMSAFIESRIYQSKSIRVETAEEQLSKVEESLRGKEAENQALKQAFLESNKKCKQLQILSDNLKYKLQNSDQYLNRTLHSKSWKLTTPLRLIGEQVRAMKDLWYTFLSLLSQGKKKVKSTKIKKIKRKPYSPLISVVIAVNVFDEALLKHCFDSVIKQSYEKCELIVVNNGSTNAFLKQITDHYKKLYPDRVCVVEIKDSVTRATARNKGFYESSGEYVLFIKPTDTLDPVALEVIVQSMQDKRGAYDLVYCDHEEPTEAGNVFKPVFKGIWNPRKLFDENYIGDLFLVGQKTLSKLGELDETLKHVEGYDLLLRMYEKNPQVKNVMRVLIRRHHCIALGKEGEEETQKVQMAARKKTTHSEEH